MKTKIAFLTYEADPILKVGGLGDVAGSLPPELKKLGLDIRVIMPLFRQIDRHAHGLKYIAGIPVNLKNKKEKINLYEANLGKSSVKVYLMENPRFSRKEIFGYPDDTERFVFYSYAALHVLESKNFKADIIHCNDWQSAIVPVLLKKLKKLKVNFFNSSKTVYTVHNLAYQGAAPFPYKNFYLSDKDFIGKKRNLVYEALMLSDLITTVSPGYAKEILTKEYGEGMEDVLKKRKKSLIGILNGIDYKNFNPKTDKFIKAKYDPSSHQARKKINKSDLLKTAGIPEKNGLMAFGIISRLAYQKGLDVVIEAVPELYKKYQDKIAIVLLGTGDPRLERQLKGYNREYPGFISSLIKFDKILAQKIYAGADAFLMPSRYEPCGLGQLIALKYGTVPVIRSTGGLKDTIAAYNGKNLNQATGFAFSRLSAGGIQKAVSRAYNAYLNQPVWNKLIGNCMMQDFSWERSAKEYKKHYLKLK